MAKISWEQGLDLEQKVAYIVSCMELRGVTFDKRRAIRQIKKLTWVTNRLYDKIRPHLTYYVLPKETKESFNSKLYKVDNFGEITLNKGDYHFVKKIRNKDGSLSKSVISFEYPELVAGPFSRVSIEEPTLSKRGKLIQQLLSAGWKPKEFTEKGTPQLTIKGVPVDSLKEMGPFGKSLSNWYICTHRLNQIQGFLDKERPDGRLTPGCNPCGTNTLRAKHHTVANLPRVTSFWGKETRALITASPGYLMVGADLSGLELRCLANRMKDPFYIDLILNGDIHTYNMEMAGLSSRDDAKTFIYAFIYGAGDAKLGEIVGGTSKDGKALRTEFLTKVPALAKLIAKVQKFSERNGWLPTLDNRKIFIRRDRGKVMVHTALNAFLQCDGAVVAKRSLLLSQEEICRRDLLANLMIYYHDEYQYESLIGYEEEVGGILVESMEKAGQFYNMLLPITGEYKIGKNWKETH